MKILFELSNCDTALDAIGPVVDTLRRRESTLQCHSLSLAEYFGVASDQQALESQFDGGFVPWPKIGDLPDEPDHLSPLVRRLRIVRETRRLLKKYLREEAFDVVVVGNDRVFPEVDVVRIASKVGVPTLLLQESIRKDLAFARRRSFLAWILQFMLGYETGRLRHGEGGCDAISAWGQAAHTYFVSIGADPAKILITGSPRLELMMNRWSRVSKEQARRDLGLPTNSKIILFASNPVHLMGIASHAQYLDAIHDIVRIGEEVMSSASNGLLLVRPHRLESARWEQNGLATTLDRANCVTLADKLPLAASIVAADGIIQFNSTVALEASMLNRPVAVVNLHDWNMGVDFVESGLAIGLRSAEQLEGHLRASLDSMEPQAADWSRYVGVVDGSASLVADAIVGLAHS